MEKTPIALDTTIEVDMDDVKKFAENPKFSQFLLSNTSEFTTAAFILDAVFKAIDKVEKDFQPIDPEDNCIIKKEELARLLADSYRLSALQAGGVDNWDWYSESIHDFLDDCETDDETEYESIDDIADAEVEHYLTLADIM